MEIESQNAVLNQAIEENKKEGTLAEKLLLIVFKLGTEEYALPIDQIKEVVLTPRISKIPQTPNYVKGVANIRGNVISIVDLELRFGLASVVELEDDDIENTDEENSNYTLVIESEEYKFGILVKEVPNTLSVSLSEIDNTSNIVRHSTLDENAINGIVKLDNRMIIMINVLSMMESGQIQSSN